MLKKLLVTGAAGAMGGVARQRLAHIAETIRISDIVPLEASAPHEEAMQCDLADPDAVHNLVAGCDGIVHLGGVSTEDKFSRILAANIQGIYNLYEAARNNGCPRILLASSNHVVGFYKRNEYLDGNALPRPDGYYGVSKCFAEAVARLYHDKFGQETAIVRIGSCSPEPVSRRMLSTWLSYDDFISLAECVFRVPELHCPVIYGVSANDACWWDNSAVSYLGWNPKDNAAAFREGVEATSAVPSKMASLHQGGEYVNKPIIAE
jgi:uronate dehydrogenase